MISTLCHPRTLALLACASLATACPDDGEQTEGSGTETSSSTDPTAPSTSMPSTSTSSSTDPSTSTDPTGTEESSSSGGTEESSTGEPVACEVVPGKWSAASWAKNTASEATLRTALADLVGDALMNGAEDGLPGVVVDDISDLTTPYEAGDPSLASIANPGYQPIIDLAFAEFVDVIDAGPVSLMEDGQWLPGAEGGIWGDGNRGINEGGLELRQLVDKGLFSGGAFYYHAVQLTEGDIDEATIDRIAYIWGNNETLDVEDLDDAAGYGYEQGFHTQMAGALTAAKAYAADPMCEAERDAALREFFVAWETSMMSRFVHYMAVMATALTEATTETEFADGLHELAEGAGLALGFYAMPDAEAGPLMGATRTITDADLDMMLGSLGIDITDLGESTTGEFVESLPNYETAQGEVEGVIMDVYGVDAATIASWRVPTPG